MMHPNCVFDFNQILFLNVSKISTNIIYDITKQYNKPTEKFKKNLIWGEGGGSRKCT